MEQLVAEIERHNRLYWENAAPEISDDAYDALLIELRRRDPGHPLLARVFPVHAAGAAGKVKLAVPMLSLDKAYSYDEVAEWAGKYARDEHEAILVQPKYDGISACYDGRILATRGDGEYGEDISDKLPLIELECDGELNRTPLADISENEIATRFGRLIRGEIVIRDDDFATLYAHIVKRGGGTYKNSRNAAAGIVGLKDISDMLSQHAKLTLVDYSKISRRIEFRDLPARFADMVREIEELPYPTDGVVFKLADTSYAGSLGATSHHPRGEIAFKFSGIRRETELLKVEWSFGKSALTPVAEFDPVEIGGVTLRHATLHNAQNVLDKDIRLHDIITVERAGDVIPYVISRREGKNRQDVMIDHCPCCNSELVRRGPELCCVNPDCFETNLQKLAAAVRNIGIEQLGEPTLRKMMTSLKVRTLADVFRLTVTRIAGLDGFAEKSAENLAASIAAARRTADYQFLAALNIPHIGPNVAKALLKVYPLERLAELSADELKAVPGIGDERAKALAAVLHDEADDIADLAQAVELTSSTGAAQESRPTVCFTGKMPEKRSYYEELAAGLGYEAVDTVASNLALLVCDSLASASSKMQKARKLGIRIIELPEFLAIAEKGADTPDSGPSELVQGQLF
ncbi:MAG: helix-hairpin-helix domain-containing protein [Victivallaceae bacterium]